MPRFQFTGCAGKWTIAAEYACLQWATQVNAESDMKPVQQAVSSVNALRQGVTDPVRIILDD